MVDANRQGPDVETDDGLDFTAVVRDHWSAVYRLASTLTGRRDATEDLTITRPVQPRRPTPWVTSRRLVVAAACLFLLGTAVGRWVTPQPGKESGPANPMVLQELVEWTSELAGCEQTQDRERIYQAQTTILAAALDQTALSEEERALGNTLLRSAAWLTQQEDALARVEHLARLSEEYHEGETGHFLPTLLVPDAMPGVPDCRVEPRGLLGGESSPIGDAEFRRQYRIEGVADGAVSRLLTGAVTDYLAKHPQFVIEIVDGTLAVWWQPSTVRQLREALRNADKSVGKAVREHLEAVLEVGQMLRR